MKALSFAGFRRCGRARVAVAEKLRQWDWNPARLSTWGRRLTVVGVGGASIEEIKQNTQKLGL